MINYENRWRRAASGERAVSGFFISFFFFLGVERKLEQVLSLVCYCSAGDKNTEFIQTEETLLITPDIILQ